MPPKNILIVDDEKDIVAIVKDFFTEEGYQVSVALSGEEAVNKLRETAAGLVILDMKMPGLSGVSLLKLINEKYPDTKAIVLTGYGDEYKNEIAKLKYGAFLTKPFSTTELIETAENVLRGVEITGEENLLYTDSHIMPRAKLLFIEPNELSYGGKKLYFSNIEKCGGEYETEAIIDYAKIEEKLKYFKPDIIIGNIYALGKEGRLRSSIMASEFKPKDIIVYGSSSDKYRDLNVVEGEFDPLTAIFVKGAMDKLGKIVRESCINNNLYTRTETPVKVPGLDIEKQGGSPSATEKKKEYTKDDIPQLVSRVVVAQLKVTEEKIRDNTRFVEDLGMDSLDSIEITMALEEELGFEIPDDDADRLRTFKQTVNYLQKKLITKKS